MTLKNKLAVGFFIAGMMFSSSLYAQFFENGFSAENNNTQQRQVASSQNARAAQQVAAQRQQAATNQRTQQRQASTFDYGTKQFNREVQAVAPKNHSPITVVGARGEEKQELILMYMKDFNVYRSPSGQTRCSVQFALATTLGTKISNISYRLQWPKMDTVLSFSDVAPMVENHFNYSLLGDGCYSMDKSPNIIINRCRVKGMSQRACAEKVRWITRM